MAFVYADNLALATILMSKKNPSGKYSLNGKEVSYESLDATLRQNLNEIAGTPALWRENKNTVFTLIEETLNKVMPKNILDVYGQFADVKTIAQGDTYVYKRKEGRMRAKQFITRVALAGRYEVFELGESKFEIKTTAYGGAARIAFEEFLDGKVAWSDYLDIINEGMAEAVYKEIALALEKSIADFPSVNTYTSNTFDEGDFDRLLATIGVYGTPVIYCTKEAASYFKTMNNNWISDTMRDEIFNNGYFLKWKGTPIVILPQSFTDETNTEKVLDPQNIWIFPTNGEKPVKIVFEGDTHVKEFENRDWSTELQTYQKFGVGIFQTNNLGIYKLTCLSKVNRSDHPIHP